MAKRTAHIGVAPVVVVLLLCGCTAVNSLGPAVPPQTYDLTSAPRTTAVAGKRSSGVDRLHLVVNEPQALRALAGDRIAIRPRRQEIQYFANASWSDQLPRLVQARMIETLGRSSKFGAVARAGDRLDADVALATDIRAFEIELDGRRAVARVDILVRLIDPRRARVLTERGFAETTRAARDSAPAGVAALDASVRAILPRVAAWAGRVKLRPASPRSLSRTPERDDRPLRNDLPLRDTQTDERETDPNARPPVSPDMLIGGQRRRRL
ncbi:MAG: ABC-type transport auxiliary lipoprotein family protein [Pseudomonadota bacterium]